MASVKSGLVGKLLMPLLALLALVWIARWVYDMLLPLVPSLITAVGLLLLLALLTRVWRR